MGIKPVCVKCQRFFKPHKNGIFCLENMPVVNRAESGTAHPEKWRPYKIWAADLWKCQGCGHEIIYGAGLSPVDEHYKPEFKEVLRTTKADQYPINDC